MNGLELIKKTREYLDYLEEHLNNIAKAWADIQLKCADMRFVQDADIFNKIDLEIKNHDLSKFSAEEFTQYRMAFYPAESENGFDDSNSWKHHIRNNPHHWENWTKSGSSNDWEIDCVHMVVDWVAMGYRFEDSARDYYENFKDRIALPKEAVLFIYKIFDRVYGKRK